MLVPQADEAVFVVDLDEGDGRVERERGAVAIGVGGCEVLGGKLLLNGQGFIEKEAQRMLVFPVHACDLGAEPVVRLEAASDEEVDVGVDALLGEAVDPVVEVVEDGRVEPARGGTRRGCAEAVVDAMDARGVESPSGKSLGLGWHLGSGRGPHHHSEQAQAFPIVLEMAIGAHAHMAFRAGGLFVPPAQIREHGVGGRFCRDGKGLQVGGEGGGQGHDSQHEEHGCGTMEEGRHGGWKAMIGSGLHRNHWVGDVATLGRGPSRTRISAKHAWQRVRAVAPALCRSIGFVHSQVVGECSGGGCPV